MSDALLKEIVAAAETLDALELRVHVIAWGITFDGTVCTSDEYDKALLDTITQNLKPLHGSGSAAQSGKAEKALMRAASVEAKEAEGTCLHLKATRTENGGTLPWLRIPFSEISGFALQTHHPGQRSTAGF